MSEQQFHADLHLFKVNLRNALYLSSEEKELFDQIPDTLLDGIFKYNFNGDVSLAEKILFNQFKEIDRSDLDLNISKIKNYKGSINRVKDYLDTQKPIVVFTDNDNDGSLAQAVLLEFKRLLPEQTKNVHIVYCQTINGNSTRGFTVDLLEKWAEENEITNQDDFLMMTADNGINSLVEQKKIEERFPNAKLVITDHHLPEKGLSVVDTENTFVFNPKFKTTKGFKNKNISGAHTLGVLLEPIVKELAPKAELRNLRNLFYVSNMLDWVQTDIRHKPLESYLIEQFQEIGPLLNINSSIAKIITSKEPDVLLDKIFEKLPELDRERISKEITNMRLENVTAAKLLHVKAKLDQDMKAERDLLTIPDSSSDLENDDDEIQTENLEDELNKEFTTSHFSNYQDFITHKVQSLFDQDKFLKDYMDTIISDEKFSHFNENYIEQLRPYIYHYTANGNKSEYEVHLLDSMKEVFHRLKRYERNIIEEFRRHDILDKIKLENVTFISPKFPEMNSLFTRRFMGRVFNEENRGFLAFFDGANKTRLMGSCRTLVDLPEILASKKGLPEHLELTFQGHHRAAGFYIERKDGSELTKTDLMTVAVFLQQKVEVALENQEERHKYVIVDPTNMGIIDKINLACKSHVGNMMTVKPLLKVDRSTYFTDNKTQEIVSIGELLKTKQYGFTPLSLNFHGDVVIMATELVRQLSENNYKDYLSLNTMSSGAFIASGVVDASKLKASDKVVLNSVAKDNQMTLGKYYKENFLDKGVFSHEVTREQMFNAPMFQNNKKFSEKEFVDVESFIISLIDKYSNGDSNFKYVVFDTEANGLGKAPKIFNFGAFEFTIDPNSGTEMPISDFIEKYKTEDIERPDNFKFDFEKGVVLINRRVKGELLSLLIKDTDFKLTMAIQSLTGISQTMLNKYGMLTGDADILLADRYKDSNCIFQAHNSNYDTGVIAANCPRLKEVIDNNLLCDSARPAKAHRLAYQDMTLNSLCKEAYDKGAFFFDDPLSEYSVSSKLKSNQENFQFPDVRSDFLLKVKGQEVFLIDLRNNVEQLLPYARSSLIENIDLQKRALPENRVKYSVVALAKQEAIRSCILHHLKESIVHIDTPEVLKNKAIIKKDKDGGDIHLSMDYDIEIAEKLFKEFCQNYHFDTTLVNNFNNFKQSVIADFKAGSFFSEHKRTEEELYLIAPEEKPLSEEEIKQLQEEAKKKKKTKKKDEEDVAPTFNEIFLHAASEFLIANKKLHLEFSTMWEYRKVLDLFDPKTDSTQVSEYEMKGLIYNTGLEKERIATIIDKVHSYKTDYKLDKFYPDELHNNIDTNGDAFLEALLFVQRLVRSQYNPYNKDQHLENALTIYDDALRTTTVKSLINQHLVSEVAWSKINSFSNKQASTYTRSDRQGKFTVSPVVKNAFNPERAEFKLKSLPEGTYIEVHTTDNFILSKLLGQEKLKQIQEDFKTLPIFSKNLDQIFIDKLNRENPELNIDTIDDLDEFQEDQIAEMQFEYEDNLNSYINNQFLQYILKESRVDNKTTRSIQESIDQYQPVLQLAILDLSNTLGAQEFTQLKSDLTSKFKELVNIEEIRDNLKNNKDLKDVKSLDQEEIQKIAEKLEFVCKFLRLTESAKRLSSKGNEIGAVIKSVLEVNADKVTEYVNDIQNNVGELQFTRAETLLKSVSEDMFNSLTLDLEKNLKLNFNLPIYQNFFSGLLTQYEALCKKLTIEFKPETKKFIDEQIKEFKPDEISEFMESLNSYYQKPLKEILGSPEFLRPILEKQVIKPQQSVSEFLSAKIITGVEVNTPPIIVKGQKQK